MFDELRLASLDRVLNTIVLTYSYETLGHLVDVVLIRFILVRLLRGALDLSRTFTPNLEVDVGLVPGFIDIVEVVKELMTTSGIGRVVNFFLLISFLVFILNRYHAPSRAPVL